MPIRIRPERGGAADMRAEHDTTVLLCTHDLAEAEALAERVGILHAGRLLALEPACELKARYGASTLEQAFFTATGSVLEEETEEAMQGKVIAELQRGYRFHQRVIRPTLVKVGRAKASSPAQPEPPKETEEA